MTNAIVKFQPQLNQVYCWDALQFAEHLPDNYVNCVVTSPPYWMQRDYSVDGQIGQEESFQSYIDRLVVLFREVRRVLRPDGVFWLNMGDAYVNNPGNGRGGERNVDGGVPHRTGGSKLSAGLKPKQLLLMPHRLAIALQEDGWWIRMDNVWAKGNPIPESVKDRTTRSHEYVFQLTKSARYWYDHEAIREKSSLNSHGSPRSNPGGKQAALGQNLKGKLGKWNSAIDTDRNKRSVWTINTEPTSEAHFATFPTALVDICIRAGCPVGGLVYDPFGGSGTTALVARELNRHYILSELNPEYVALANRRLAIPYTPMLFDAHASYDKTDKDQSDCLVDSLLPGFENLETA